VERAGSFIELDRYVRHREPNFGMLELMG